MLDQLIERLVEQLERKPKRPEPQQRTTTKEKGAEKAFTRINMEPDLKNVPAPHVEPPKQEPKTGKRLKSASRMSTIQKTSTIQPSEEMLRKLAGIDPSLRDEISDEQALRHAGYQRQDLELGERPIPTTPATLPAVINKSLVAKGMVEPEWHMVKHLPGYLSQPIRAIGRGVFKALTRTPIENIQVIANLMGQGPNESKEINAVANYLVKNAVEDRDAEIIFHQHIPDYGAEIKIYKALEGTFMLVKDFAGEYVYAWPTDKELPKLEVK